MLPLGSRERSKAEEKREQRRRRRSLQWRRSFFIISLSNSSRRRRRRAPFGGGKSSSDDGRSRRRTRRRRRRRIRRRSGSASTMDASSSLPVQAAIETRCRPSWDGPRRPTTTAGVERPPTSTRLTSMDSPPFTRYQSPGSIVRYNPSPCPIGSDPSVVSVVNG